MESEKPKEDTPKQTTSSEDDELPEDPSIHFVRGRRMTYLRKKNGELSPVPVPVPPTGQSAWWGQNADINKIKLGKLRIPWFACCPDFQCSLYLSVA